MAKSAKTAKKGSAKSGRTATKAKAGASRSARSSKTGGGARKASGSSRKSSGGGRKTSGGGGRKSSGGGRRPNAAFMAPVTPSPQLAEVVGEQPLPRTELTKKLWAYIKKNGLQDQKNRRMINSDDRLRPIFGGKSQVSMFDMTKMVNKHVKA